MINRIRNIFKHNKLLKLISIAIAFGIWLMVVNVSNPEMKSSVSSSIEVDYGESLTNLDKYYNLDTYNAKVSFSVRTNQRTSVSSADFRVYVDMRDYSITGAIPVYVTVDDRVKDIVSDVNVTPLVVHATTEDMQEKTFDLEPSVVGSPADGFAAGKVNYSPSHVTLFGPDSEIGKISRIGFNINVSDASSDVWGTADFIYYDANNNEISPDSRIVVKNSASYNVPIYKKKNVSIMVQASGEPAEGYEIGIVDCEPDFVSIYGPDDVINSINAIILPSTLLNVSNASSDVSASIDIENYLPENVYTDNVGNIALVARINKAGTAAADGQTGESTESAGSEGETESESNTETTSEGNGVSGSTHTAGGTMHNGAAEPSGSDAKETEADNAEANANGADSQGAHESSRQLSETVRETDAVVTHGTGNLGSGLKTHKTVSE